MSSNYDALNDSNKPINEEERKRREAIEREKQQLKQGNTLGYPTLDAAHAKEAKNREAARNTFEMTRPAYGEAAQAYAKPAQVERPAPDKAPQQAQAHRPARGDMQLAPGGTMFTSPPRAPPAQQDQAQQPEQKARKDHHAQRRAEPSKKGEMTEARAAKADRENAQEMTGRKVEHQRFKINLTEQQKEDLARLGDGPQRGGGRSR